VEAHERAVTPNTPGIDHEAVARAQAEVARAIATSHEAQAVLDLVVERVRALLGARVCFVILVGGDQRVRITASTGLRSGHREVLPRHDRDGIAMTAMTERRPVWSADVLNDPAIYLSPPSRGFVESEGYRPALAVPLLADARVLGVLMAGRDQVGGFSPGEVALAQAFADHVTIALERARLTSLEAARTRLDEALVEVDRELLGELSLDRLLPLIVEQARRLVAAHGSLYLAEAERRWLRQAWTSWPQPLGGLAFGAGLVGTCAESRRGLLVDDYPAWSKAHPPAVALGMRHVMAQPLLSRGQLLGVIVMGRGDPAPPFESRDLALLERFAMQAALALRNATLYGEAEYRRRAAEALARMARALSESPDPDALAEQVVASVGGLFDLACTVRLIRPDGALVAIASTDVARGHVQAPGTGLTARVLAKGRAAVAPDLSAEPDLALDDDLQRRGAHRGVLIAPLRAGRRIIGVLQIVAPAAREFSPLDMELAQAFADQAAPALESAQLHADLRMSEERTRLIIDTALDAVITIDLAGRIIGWNVQAERTFGWAREDAIGRVLSETIIPARYRAAHEEGLRRYRSSGQGPVINRRLELAALHRDGREFPVELSISPVAVGPVTTFSAFVRDITQRTEAEEAIRRHTAQVRLLQMVAVAANEAPSTRVALQIGVDRICAYTGWPVGDAFVLADDGSGDLVAAGIWHLEHPERYRRFQQISDRSRFSHGVGLPGRVLASGQATWIMDITRDPNFPRANVAVDIDLKCAFGFPVLAGSEVVAVLEFFTGEPHEPDPALLETMANIGTQLGRVFERQRSEKVLRLAKDAAEAASRAKSSFLANMSHELRTPLNAILGYAQVLARDADLGPQHRRAIGVIEGSGEHLLSLINEILDLARIEAGTIEVQGAPFDLAALLSGIADLVSTRAEDKGLVFACELPAAVPAAVHADEKRLRQVLVNLLDNAIKYTVRGRVALSVARHDGRYHFMVEDTGIGISAEELPRIFETFHQVRSAQAFAEGTGLGLAISKTLVALMGGSLEVSSTPGEGSRFWFELDLPEVAPADDGSSAEQRIVGVRGARRRVLVVDDKADNRQLLHDLLAPAGFEVEAAADAEACLASVASGPPDAVLLDLRMPGMSGLEATRRLRALDGGHRLVIIAVSASVFGHHREECIAAGADDFLAKPLRLERLLDLLCRLLGLEPVREERRPDRASRPAREPAASAAIVFPPSHVLAPLLEQARRGDIKQVLEHAERIEAGDPRYRPFVHELRALAEEFQVKKLCRFLEERRPAP
jgi:PAS domain S-box-containing protein